MKLRSPKIAIIATLTTLLSCAMVGAADHAFYITLGPQLIVNTESTTKSAPSPIVFAFGMGMQIPCIEHVSFEPALTFFTTYYLWDGENALPAEVENRTASVLACMVDLPVVYTWDITQNHHFELGGGLAVLARVGILAGNVSGSDTGTSGSVSSDVAKINDWFWQKNRFLYPELMGSWLYTVSSRLQVGCTPRIYIPLGSLMDNRGLDGMIIQISAKALFR